MSIITIDAPSFVSHCRNVGAHSHNHHGPIYGRLLYSFSHNNKLMGIAFDIEYLDLSHSASL